MTLTTFRFTKKSLQDLPTPAHLETYHDTVARGLKCVVRPSGTKTFILYRKVNGKPERITLGRFPDLTIEQARGKAAQLNADIANGKNPAKSKRAIRNEITFAELFETFINQYAKIHKRSWQEDENRYRLYLQPWATRRLSSLQRSDIQRLHTQLGQANGIYAANRTLALLQTLFNKAIEWGWEHSNPVTGIKKFKEQSRERFIEADELPRFFQSLAEETNTTVRDFVLMSLLTGARRANVLAMRWDEVNLERATWTIPQTKTGEPHTVPLVSTAIDLLHQRQRRNQRPWIFPGHSASGHLEEPKKVWQRILKRANIQNLRLHDLRRSLGSWQAATGANLSIIGKTLAHKNVQTTAIYARLNLDPVREAMNKATTAILKAAKFFDANSNAQLAQSSDYNSAKT